MSAKKDAERKRATLGELAVDLNADELALIRQVANSLEGHPFIEAGMEGYIVAEWLTGEALPWAIKAARRGEKRNAAAKVLAKLRDATFSPEEVKAFAERAAREILGQLGDACGEIAHEWREYSKGDADTAKRVRKLRRAWVTDIEGALADQYYNDAGLVGDLLGDWAHDAAGGSPRKFAAILDRLEAVGHDAVAVAVRDIRTRHAKG